MGVVRKWSISAQDLEEEGQWCELFQDPGTRYVAIPHRSELGGSEIKEVLSKFTKNGTQPLYDLFSIPEWYSEQHIRDELLSTGEIPIYVHAIAPADDILLLQQPFTESLSIAVEYTPFYLGIIGTHEGYEIKAEVQYNGQKTRSKRTIRFSDIIRETMNRSRIVDQDNDQEHPNIEDQNHD